VVVQAAARVDNKHLLEVAQRAADAGAKVGGWGALCCHKQKLRQSALVAASWAPALWAAVPALPLCKRHAAARAQFAAAVGLLACLQIILEAVDKPRNVQFKGATDLVTDTDTASEAAILAVIQGAFPGHAVLGEEGGVTGESACTWWAAGRSCRGVLPLGWGVGGGGQSWRAPQSLCVPSASWRHTPAAGFYSCCNPPATRRPAGDTNSEYLWCVDPLDGTTNFTHGYPSFAVSVAVLRHTTPVASTGKRR
jgi:3'-phosphoadenosine 5'-phosphosulfate (PAPS) 3'-phosphatase